MTDNEWIKLMELLFSNNRDSKKLAIELLKVNITELRKKYGKIIGEHYIDQSKVKVESVYSKCIRICHSYVRPKGLNDVYIPYASIIYDCTEDQFNNAINDGYTCVLVRSDYTRSGEPKYFPFLTQDLNYFQTNFNQRILTKFIKGDFEYGKWLTYKEQLKLDIRFPNEF